MDVICEMMKLRPECVKEYISMHDTTWTGLIEAIKASGFIEEYIFLLGDIVIIIMKCKSFKESASRLAEKEVFKEWTKKVRAMLIEDEKLFHTKDHIIDLNPIWNLSDF